MIKSGNVITRLSLASAMKYSVDFCLSFDFINLLFQSFLGAIYFLYAVSQEIKRRQIKTFKNMKGGSTSTDCWVQLLTKCKFIVETKLRGQDNFMGGKIPPLSLPRKISAIKQNLGTKGLYKM